eukprot:6182951-Pleurochrysis_carterae.AAC.1
MHMCSERARQTHKCEHALAVLRHLSVTAVTLGGNVGLRDGRCVGVWPRVREGIIQHLGGHEVARRSDAVGAKRAHVLGTRRNTRVGAVARERTIDVVQNNVLRTVAVHLRRNTRQARREQNGREG